MVRVFNWIYLFRILNAPLGTLWLLFRHGCSRYSRRHGATGTSNWPHSRNALYLFTFLSFDPLSHPFSNYRWRFLGFYRGSKTRRYCIYEHRSRRTYRYNLFCRPIPPFPFLILAYPHFHCRPILAVCRSSICSHMCMELEVKHFSLTVFESRPCCPLLNLKAIKFFRLFLCQRIPLVHRVIHPRQCHIYIIRSPKWDIQL